jgi:hypothetical protein
MSREYWRSRCGTGVFGIDIASATPKSANFPVKFPVCREFVGRRVRSALRRQPGSPAIGEATLEIGEMSANGGLLPIG